MKLISWDEKYPDRKKDAEDLLFIMEIMNMLLVKFMKKRFEAILYLKKRVLITK